MKLNRYTLILFLIFSCNSKSALDYTKEALKYSDEGNYKKSNLLLDKAIEKDPDFIGAYINKGANLSDIGEYQKAIEIYRKALVINSENTMLLFNLGNNYRLLNDNATALDFYNKAFKTKGGDKFFIDYNTDFDYTNRDLNYDVLGKEIYFQRGIAYLELDSIKQSYSDFTNSIKRNYKIAESYYYIGILYLNIGEDSLACDYLKKSLSLGDEDALITIQEYCE